MPNSDNLGAWARSDFDSTLEENIGVGFDAGFPDDIRFLAGVARLIRKRMSEQGAEADPTLPAVFLLEPTPRGVSDWKNVPMLDNGLTVVSGRLWFVPASVTRGSFIDIEHHDDEGLFSFVTDTLDLGRCPAVVFDPRTSPPHARYYAGGLEGEEYEPLRIGAADLSLSEVFKAIDRVYSDCLITPDAQTKASKLWEDAEKWWPKKDAEDIIQSQLKPGLVGRFFHTCEIRHEQTGPTGRLDIDIMERDPQDKARILNHIILELKVLRSFSNGGTSYTYEKTIEWVHSGVSQAAAYRIERQANAAALCCFDMRTEETGDECFDGCREQASELQIELRLWFLYASSALMRRAKYGVKPSEGQ